MSKCEIFNNHFFKVKEENGVSYTIQLMLTCILLHCWRDHYQKVIFIIMNVLKSLLVDVQEKLVTILYVLVGHRSASGADCPICISNWQPDCYAYRYLLIVCACYMLSVKYCCHQILIIVPCLVNRYTAVVYKCLLNGIGDICVLGVVQLCITYFFTTVHVLLIEFMTQYMSTDSSDWPVYIPVVYNCYHTCMHSSCGGCQHRLFAWKTCFHNIRLLDAVECWIGKSVSYACIKSMFCEYSTHLTPMFVWDAYCLGCKPVADNTCLIHRPRLVTLWVYNSFSVSDWVNYRSKNDVSWLSCMFFIVHCMWTVFAQILRFLANCLVIIHVMLRSSVYIISYMYYILVYLTTIPPHNYLPKAGVLTEASNTV